MASGTAARGSAWENSPSAIPRPSSSADIMPLVAGLHNLYFAFQDHVEEFKRRPALHYCKIVSAMIHLAAITLYLTWDHTGTFQGVSTVCLYSGLAVWVFELDRLVSKATSIFVQALESIAVCVGEKCNKYGITGTIVALAWTAFSQIQYIGWVVHAGLCHVLLVLTMVVSLALAVGYMLSRGLLMSIYAAFLESTQMLRTWVSEAEEFYRGFHSGLWLNMGPPLIITREEWNAACARYTEGKKEKRRVYHEDQMSAAEREYWDASVGGEWRSNRRAAAVDMATPQSSDHETDAGPVSDDDLCDCSCHNSGDDADVECTSMPQCKFCDASDDEDDETSHADEEKNTLVKFDDKDDMDDADDEEANWSVEGEGYSDPGYSSDLDQETLMNIFLECGDNLL